MQVRQCERSLHITRAPAAVLIGRLLLRPGLLPVLVFFLLLLIVAALLLLHGRRLGRLPGGLFGGGGGGGCLLRGGSCGGGSGLRLSLKGSDVHMHVSCTCIDP